MKTLSLALFVCLLPSLALLGCRGADPEGPHGVSGSEDLASPSGRGQEVSPPEEASDEEAPGADDATVVPHQTGLEVQTTHGTLQGHEEDGTLRVFKGIPYAQSTAGENRLRAPQPLLPWEGVLDADEYGDACPAKFALGTMSEDCLNLNVWSHQDAEKRPVMVWIFGGGFMVGETGLSLYEGDDLAKDANVVVISINYRLGALGGLALEELRDEDPLGAMGNMGLLDQIEALRWIKANAAAFGGDPENITVFGESAGAMSTCALLAAPLADDLFHKAIIQSGACHLNRLAQDHAFGGNAITTSENVANHLGCEAGPERLACLRAANVQDLVDATNMFDLFTDMLGIQVPAGPTIDGVVLPQSPHDKIVSGDVPDRPVLFGSNSNEAALFTIIDFVVTRGEFRQIVADAFGGEELAEQVVELYSPWDFPLAEDAYNAFLGEILFNCNTYEVAKSLEGSGFVYHLEVGPSLLMTTYGPTHAAELPYVFGDFVGTGLLPTVLDLALSQQIQESWGDFARNGAPTWEGGWPATTQENPGSMAIDLFPAFESEHRDGRCDELRALGILP
jgi:para-nitrobenzyl esterase